MPDAELDSSGDQRGVVPDLRASSFADFLSRWLIDAMLEFKGAEFQGPEIP